MKKREDYGLYGLALEERRGWIATPAVLAKTEVHAGLSVLQTVYPKPRLTPGVDSDPLQTAGLENREAESRICLSGCSTASFTWWRSWIGTRYCSPGSCRSLWT